MATITISDNLLRRIATINQLSIPNTELIFIGFRGTMMNDPNANNFSAQMNVETIDVNYINPRCTLAQWSPTTREIALFPGSTVPYKDYVDTSLARGGAGTNCLVPGFYTDYVKAIHKNGKPTGHEAFKETALHPIRRASNNDLYNTDDAINYENPYDDIHCGWFEAINSNRFSSAGCQVIMGLPKCPKRGNLNNTGPWKTFHDNAYRLGQTSFPYLLIDNKELLNIYNNINAPMQPILKIGSSGTLVKEVQNVLKNAGYYESTPDGDFGWRTCKAVTQFQLAVFGIAGVDAIVGPHTFSDLGINPATV